MQWMSMSEISKLLTSEIVNFAPTADIVCSFFAFIVLMLLVGRQKEHQACEN